MQTVIGNTFAERDYRLVGAAIQARLDARKLFIYNAHELRVARRLGAVRCRGDDASTHIVGVAGVLAICDRRGDERGLVRNTLGLGEVDHLVGNVLLVADAARGQKRVDASQARELHAWLVRENITAADKLYITPILGQTAGVGGRKENVHRELASPARR